MDTRARARPPSGVGHNSATNLAERWFRRKTFETDGRLYRWLGVVAFKRLLMRVVRKSPAKPNTVNSHVLAGRSLRHVGEFEIKSRRSELIHLVGLAMGILCLGLRAIDDRLIIAAIIAFALNFPCFALQRFNRARIYRVLQRAPANSHLYLEG
jgi:Glycosyl-4,4'-diaponeurosporenoate acyltransferase